MAAAARKAQAVQDAPSGNLAQVNTLLRQTEADFMNPAGLPNRPWFKHVIFAPGEYTGYAPVVIPGVTEAVEARNGPLAAQQLTVLTQALDRAAQTLNSVQ